MHKNAQRGGLVISRKGSLDMYTWQTAFATGVRMTSMARKTLSSQRFATMKSYPFIFLQVSHIWGFFSFFHLIEFRHHDLCVCMRVRVSCCDLKILSPVCATLCLYPHTPRALTPSVLPLSSYPPNKDFHSNMTGLFLHGEFKGSHPQILCRLYQKLMCRQS